MTALETQKRRRDGGMIAFLALLPIRNRAFIELTLGCPIELGSAGIMVRLDGIMTKNGYPWEARVPDVLEPVLTRYATEVRP